MKCENCGCSVACRDDQPKAERVWCSQACCDLWLAEHPEEAAKWTAIDALTFLQRAELDATLGLHAGDA